MLNPNASLGWPARGYLGLGATKTLDPLEVPWPDSSHSTPTHVATRQRLTVQWDPTPAP